MLAFYLVAPFPVLISRRVTDDSSSSPCREMAVFVTSAIVVSAFSLPIILARAPTAAPVVSAPLPREMKKMVY